MWTGVARLRILCSVPFPFCFNAAVQIKTGEMPSLLHLLNAWPHGFGFSRYWGGGWWQERYQDNALSHFSRWRLKQRKVQWNRALYSSINKVFFPLSLSGHARRLVWIQMELQYCMWQRFSVLLWVQFPALICLIRQKPLSSAPPVSSAPTIWALLKLSKLWTKKT